MKRRGRGHVRVVVLRDGDTVIEGDPVRPVSIHGRVCPSSAERAARSRSHFARPRRRATHVSRSRRCRRRGRPPQPAQVVRVLERLPRLRLETIEDLAFGADMTSDGQLDLRDHHAVGRQFVAICLAGAADDPAETSADDSCIAQQ